MNDYVMTKKNKILIVIFSIISIILIIFQIFNNDKKQSNIEIVKSSSKFYTVSNCIDRYLKYLFNEDVDNILLLLDKNYIKENNISKDNLFSKIDKFDGINSFVGKKMYQEVIKDNITKYYVKGYLLKDVLDNSDVMVDYYIIVILDNKNSTYSIIPYDGEIFSKEDLNEK